MPYQEVTETDTPNSGKDKSNANDSELYERVQTLENKAVPVISFASPTSNFAWSNQPAAETEIFGSDRLRARWDLSWASQARIVGRVMVAGAPTAEIRLQYSPDGASYYYADGSSGPALSLSATGTVAGAWTTLAAGALADVRLRLVGVNGDGVADPALGSLQVQMR